MAQSIKSIDNVVDAGVCPVHERSFLKSRSLCPLPVSDEHQLPCLRATSLPCNFSRSTPIQSTERKASFITQWKSFSLALDATLSAKYDTALPSSANPATDTAFVARSDEDAIHDLLPGANIINGSTDPISSCEAADSTISSISSSISGAAKGTVTNNREPSPVEVVGSRELTSAQKVVIPKISSKTDNPAFDNSTVNLLCKEDRESSPGLQITSVRRIFRPRGAPNVQQKRMKNVFSPATGTFSDKSKSAQLQHNNPTAGAQKNGLKLHGPIANAPLSISMPRATNTKFGHPSIMRDPPSSLERSIPCSYSDAYSFNARCGSMPMQNLDGTHCISSTLSRRAASPINSTAAKRLKSEVTKESQNQCIASNNSRIFPDGYPQYQSSATEKGQPHLTQFNGSTTSSSCDSEGYGKGKRWTARTWTSSQYSALAQACELSFPFVEFEVAHGKSRNEVLEVFAAVIQTPLLSRSGRGPGELRGGLGEERVKERKIREKEMGCAQKKLRKLQEKDREAERNQLRNEVEVEVWNTMERQGWIKIENAKAVLIEKEKERQKEHEAKQTGFDSAAASSAFDISGFHRLCTPAAKARKTTRVKTVDEATDELQAASAELLKAKKAEERKMKRLEKNKRDSEDIKERKTEERNRKKLEKANKFQGKGQL